MVTNSVRALRALAVTSALWAAASGPACAEASEAQVLHLGGVRLGVELMEVSADQATDLGLSAPAGARVVGVRDGSAAEKAGIREDDVILEFDGEAIRGVAHLARLVRETPAGREVSLEILRDGQRQRLSVAPDESRFGELLGDLSSLRHMPLPEHFDFDFDAPEGDGERFVWRFRDRRPRLGIRYQDVSGQLAGYFGLKDSGVIVVHVDEDSPASRAGLQAGDALLELGGRAIEDGRDLGRAVRDLEGGEPASLRVLRKGQERTLEVQVEEPRPPRPRGRTEAL